MKILLISDSFPPDSSGGASRIVYNLFNGLRQASHQVFVLTTTQDEDKISNGKEGIYKIFAPNYNVRWKSYRSLYNLKALKQVKKIIKDLKPDIIHFHNVHYYLSYACFKIAKKSNTKTFLTAHDVDLVIPSKMKEFINPLLISPLKR
ncbi:glycosyltransferase, partial [Patescibacteria group bacterium]|nr:glycosyltransferase [Patescibacteria group bacterium]